MDGRAGHLYSRLSGHIQGKGKCKDIEIYRLIFRRHTDFSAALRQTLVQMIRDSRIRPLTVVKPPLKRSFLETRQWLFLAVSTNWAEAASWLLNLNDRLSASSLCCSEGTLDPYAEFCITNQTCRSRCPIAVAQV